MRYDVRGEYPEEINEGIAAIIGNSLPYSKNVVIGGDLRTSTPYLKNALISSLNADSVYDIGIANSDLVAFFSREKKVKGIVVTASHNPWNFNGFKFLNETSTPFTNEQLEEIKSKALTMKTVERREKVYKLMYQEAYDAYFSKINEVLGNKFNIIVYAINSAALPPLRYGTAQGLIDLNVKGKNYVLDTSLSSNPSLDYVEGLRLENAVVLDADADRGVIVDNYKVVNAHALIYGYAKALNAKKIVVSVDFSEVLKEKLEEEGIKVEVTRVGDVFVSNECYANRCDFFAEPNYHFGFPSISYYSSGVLAGLFYDAMNVRKYLPSVIPFFHSESMVLDKVLFEKLKDNITKKYEVINQIDGIKFKVGSSYVLLRFSGTFKNKLRIYVESEDANESKKSIAEIKMLIKEVM